VEIPGPQIEQLGAIARRHGVVLSVGVTEKGPLSIGQCGTQTLIFDADGRLLNRHRKLVPTWAEKLTWSNGDAWHLRVERTALGRLGALSCGENTKTLAGFALLAQGEQVHIATYPPAWPTRRGVNIGANANSLRELLSSAAPAASMILGSQGEPLAEPQVGGESIVVADIDGALSIEQKQFHDTVGYYNRFDIFRLSSTSALKSRLT
jgi:nitrilase